VAAAQGVARRWKLDAEFRAECGSLVDGEAALEHDARVAEPAVARAVGIALPHERIAAHADAPVGRERELECVRQGLPPRGIYGVGGLHAGFDLEPAGRGQCGGAGDAGAVGRDGGGVVGRVGGDGGANKGCCNRRATKWAVGSEEDSHAAIMRCHLRVFAAPCGINQEEIQGQSMTCSARPKSPPMLDDPFAGFDAVLVNEVASTFRILLI
jgi:hypothetical protein